MKKNQHSRPANFIISVKPQAKKAKTEVVSEKQPSELNEKPPPDIASNALGGLVSYSDESEDED